MNIVDLLICQRTGEDDLHIFRSLEELRIYSKQTGRYFPKDSLEAGALLEHLLREIFSTSMLRMRMLTELVTLVGIAVPVDRTSSGNEKRPYA